MSRRRVVIEVEFEDIVGDEPSWPAIMLLPDAAAATGTRIAVTDHDAVVAGGRHVGHGEWFDDASVRVRVSAPISNGDTPVPASDVHADDPSGDTPVHPPAAMPDAGGASEIVITTIAGQRVRRLRQRVDTTPGWSMVVGRSRQGTDLIVDDDHVSRMHLRLFAEGGRIMVEDLRSKWGTTINDRPLVMPTPLADGDEVHFGKSSIRFVGAPSPEERARMTTATTLSALPPPRRPSAHDAPLAGEDDAHGARRATGPWTRRLRAWCDSGWRRHPAARIAAAVLLVPILAAALVGLILALV